MENINGKIIAFSASLAVGFLIVLNIKLEKAPLNKQLNTKEYKEAVDERNKLLSEIDLLETEKNTSIDRIGQYTNVDKKQGKIAADMLEQVNDYGMVSGMLAIKGQGVVIKIKDGDINRRKDTPAETLSKIFHDNDAAMVLNEIRLSGAEAIALNNHRIIPSTSVNCNGAFIGFDDYSMEAAPFYFYVIGDPEQLKLNLSKEGSYLNKLIIRKLKVEIEEKDEIIIPSSKQNFTPAFMKEYTKKK
ncbi:MAG: DUF881 domain-containing protein [Clostridium sp.]